MLDEGRAGNHCFSEGKTAWSCRCLAPQTWSVPDSVRTDLQTLRLAIANATAAIGPCTLARRRRLRRPARWRKETKHASADASLTHCRGNERGAIEEGIFDSFCFICKRIRPSELISRALLPHEQYDARAPLFPG